MASTTLGLYLALFSLVMLALSWPLGDAVLRGCDVWGHRVLAKALANTAQAYQRSPEKAQGRQGAPELVQGHLRGESVQDHLWGAEVVQSHRRAPGARPIALVHVGPWKTATTYSQRIFQKSEGALRQRDMVYFLPPHVGEYEGKAIEPAHHFLARFLDSVPREDEEVRADLFKEKVRDTLAKGHHMIISSEALSNVRPTAVQMLKDMLLTYDAKVVFTYRGFLGWMWSGYRQGLWAKNKAYHNVSFAEYFKKKAPIIRDGLYELAEKYFAAFGREKVFILDYLGACSGGDITNQILSAAGLPTLQEPFNESVTSGIRSEEVLYQQIWQIFADHMSERHECALQWPKWWHMLADKPEVIFKHDAMPRTCLDMEPLKRFSLEVDAEFREKFKDRILHSRPELTAKETNNFKQICELDAQAVRRSWKKLFEKQAAALPRHACKEE